LIEIVELMKQGARRVLVRKNITEACTVDKKPFAPFYKAELKITGTPRAAAAAGKQTVNRSSSSPPATFGCDRYCCLTREDIVRFLINCLGALAPTPLQSISSLGAVNRGYAHVEASSPAIEASWMVPAEPRAVAVVQTNRHGTHKVLADVSAHRLWRRDYVAARTPWRACRPSTSPRESRRTGCLRLLASPRHCRGGSAAAGLGSRTASSSR